LQELRKRLKENHGTCAEAVAKKAAADAVSVATVKPNVPNVLQTMMKLQQDKSRAEAANKLALEVEKERDAAEKAVEELKRQLQPKRPHTDDDAGDAHEVVAEVENWDLRDHRQQATRVQNRRNVQLGSRQNQVKPRAGTNGFLHHTRLGLVGWIAQEERQVCPGHFWLLKFGKVPGRNSCVEKKFKLGTRKYEEYKGVRFGNGDCALVVDVWFHRVDEDASGLTFEEWDPSVDTDASEAPVAMIVNSSELCAAGFDLREVIPL
jgi:hypothetical protein